nr:S8 family serine peptidase [Apilactobacillus kunkeei]
MYQHVLYSPNVTIGVVDSGIASHQSSLNGTVIKKGSINLVPKGGFDGKEKNENGNKGYIYDKIGHGTMIAGQISGHGKIIGVYPNAGLHIYRVIGRKQSNPFWIMKGIVAATNNRDSVINVSLGKYLYSSKSMKKNMEFKAWNRTIRYARKHGSIIVASAGENGYDEDDINKFKNSFSKDNNINIKKINYLVDVPAMLKNVISVGSIGPSGKVSNFSNTSKKINLFAPGGDTTEYFRYGSNYWNNHNLNSKKLITVATINNSYSYAYGTSLASAKVSALLAEYIAIQKIKKHYKNIKSRFLKYFKSYRKKIDGNIIINSNS